MKHMPCQCKRKIRDNNIKRRKVSQNIQNIQWYKTNPTEKKSSSLSLPFPSLSLSAKVMPSTLKSMQFKICNGSWINAHESKYAERGQRPDGSRKRGFEERRCSMLMVVPGCVESAVSSLKDSGAGL
jgi:hypothetical protein